MAKRQNKCGGGKWPPGLPVPLTELVGRDREIGDVKRLLAGNRLVTLVGSGGVGKTRLAIEAAAAVAVQFADGAVLVDLSSVADSDLVLSAVAQVVGVEDRADSGLERRVVDVLRQEDLLLVLDNCEHLLSGCAELAARLLGRCPGLRVLATSRQDLGIPGEVTWRVPSLAFPWPGQLLSSEMLGEFGAVALFVDRARAARPDLVIASDDIAALTSICFRLDGIPLALELAAARVSALSIREIAEHLDASFVLLARNMGGPARHQTLRASVDWSHQLLSPAEQVLFRRFAVFAGGWSLPAAEAVGSGPPVGHGEVARLLAALVDKSLVQAQDTSCGTRYRLLEAIKTFAYEQLLASGELENIHAGHGRYYADLGEHVATMLHGPDQGNWASRLDDDQGNFRAARLWCAQDPARAELGLKMAAGLGEYWLIRGLLEEGADWLHDALEHAADAGEAKATALTWLAVFTSLRSDFGQGGQYFEAAITLHEQAGDRQGQARALAILGFWRANQDRRHGAADALDRALELAQQSGDPYFVGFALLMASMTATLIADPALAQVRAADSVKVFNEIGDRRGAGYARCVLAECLIRGGDPQEGLAILRMCVSDFESMLDRWGLLISTGSAVLAHAALSDWSRTAIAAGVADSLSERIGTQLAPAIQAPIDASTARTAVELGAAAGALREAGRAVGRTDQISAALGLAAEPAPPQTQQVLPLTTRECEIAELIAAGLTNRQIGQRLFIAQRTVDTHVAHILAKLSCSNRAQVAALMSTGVGEKIRTPST